MLADRVVAVSDWIKSQPDLHHLHLGYFGASTGGGGALVASVQSSNKISAVVSRGGRPDLAGEKVLKKVECPTMLIIGGDDDVVIDLNRLAYNQLKCEKEMKIIPGATHLFEEPGKLEEVARISRVFLEKHLTSEERLSAQ
eukprot:TRINITY_DN16546_c0_g1_i1.p1 TRINITY_DN16546_c0_g1~~TRINITY_DN16546_c0_g1_i1.p1  ORF type:complete len:141 (+),score=45.22 TRINITY_DN16546_c0_g1_i1:174-596(+)